MDSTCSVRMESDSLEDDPRPMAAIKDEFPNAQLHRCLFHFTQGVWKENPV